MGKILALDPGDKWVGIAISDPSHLVARPFQTAERHNLFGTLTEIFAKENIELILIGHPITMAGKDSSQTKKIHILKVELEEKFPNHRWMLWDERKTSQQAAALQSQTRKRHDPLKKEESHALAAAFILDSYLALRPMEE